MFQETRQRLAIWYTTVTAILLLVFASGFYLYVRNTLIERIDDTLSHVVEVVQRSLVIESVGDADHRRPQLNLESSFHDNPDSVEDDHIDLEWFSPEGELLWSTFSTLLDVPFHPIATGETIHLDGDQLLRQITNPIAVSGELLGYLRVSHPWFEVTKPTRQLIRDLALGMTLMIGTVAGVGWFLSGLAIAPVRDSYQRLKQFTADASHELRNPIAVIQTNVQVALSDPNPDVMQQQGQLQVIERLTRRLGRLVDDLLFLARQDSNRLARQDGVALDELLREVVEEQRAIATEKGIHLSLEIRPPWRDDWPYQVLGDRDQLMRLLINLISNAIQYTPTHGQVTLTLQSTKQVPPQFQITVGDTGIGIPTESLPYIYDRFYRVDPARRHVSSAGASSASGGSGLGLAIAQVIVENHHGQIEVESQPGQGTRFVITFPGQRPEAPVTPKPVTATLD